jgi:hypothetical protein
MKFQIRTKNHLKYDNLYSGGKIDGTTIDEGDLLLVSGSFELCIKAPRDYVDDCSAYIDECGSKTFVDEVNAVIPNSHLDRLYSLLT